MRITSKIRTRLLASTVQIPQRYRKTRKCTASKPEANMIWWNQNRGKIGTILFGLHQHQFQRRAYPSEIHIEAPQVAAKDLAALRPQFGFHFRCESGLRTQKLDIAGIQ